MKIRLRSSGWQAAVAALVTGVCAQALALPVDVSDATGDSSGLDLTRLRYEVTNNAVEIRLTLAQDLEGAFGDANGIINVDLDLDRSLLSGFATGRGWHPRFGIDYRIELALSGFGADYVTGFLLYWQHHYDPPFLTVDKKQIALGDFMFPNGSVFVVGTNPTYGTDAHQIFVRIPLALFNNNAFPICGDASFCYNTAYPCPLPLTPDARTTLLCVSCQPAIPFTENDLVDWIPDSGMIDAATGGILPSFPTGNEDLVAQTTDPVGDPWGGTALNGEDITAFKVFLHTNDTLTFDLQLAGVNMANTAFYHVVLDVDDNPATGEPFANGVPLGVDVILQFAIPDNQVGEPNPLEGKVKLWQRTGYCDLPDFDCLGTMTYGSPGHVAISLPRFLLAPYLAANTSGRMKVLAGTSANNVLFTGFDDVAPDTGALSIPLGAAPLSSLRITAFERRTGGVFNLRCTSVGTAFARLDLQSAPHPSGPWLPDPVVLTALGGGVYQGTITNTASAGARFFRIASTP
jgi:hypothetical protein